MSSIAVRSGHASPRGRLPALVQAMMRPDFYSHLPATVELCQTHLSYVFLASEYVYKIKKALRFPFVDCSTLDRRRHLCEEEVRLNRRLAPDTYIGVVAIVRADDGFALDEQDRAAHRRRSCAAKAVEFAVKMHRLPEDRMLDRLLERRLATLDDIRALARRLAAFHGEAPSTSGAYYGCPAAVWKMVAGNIEECERFEGHTCEARDLAALLAHTRDFVANHWALLNRRARQGRVREGHGDLRCEHVCIDGGKLTVFDCVEFSEALRYGDVACDIGFLVMDLERLGAPEFAGEFARAYVAAADDDTLAILLRFYQCYRATVRAKVESLRSLAAEVPPAEREQARAAARRYFELACHYANRLRREELIAVCGLSGSGKSTLARKLAQQLGFEVVSSDQVRKCFELPAAAHGNAQYGAGIYADDFNRRTYDALLDAARAAFARGDGIILDATFRHPAERRAVMELSAQSGVPVLFVECRADEAEIVRRLNERERRGDNPSDANVQVYLRQRDDFAPLTELPPQCHLVVDTTNGVDTAARVVCKALESRTRD
ncbi:MAG: AAA family ATPase [Candidatus Binataceae bacterium]